MTVRTNRPLRFDRLVYLPVAGALVVMWITLGAFTLVERKIILERARSQLGATVSMLADFNELAEQATGGPALRSNDARSAAIWRALLQYPTASIWVDTGGVISGGVRPSGDLAEYLLVDDARSNFVIHAALPQVDALFEWRRALWQRGAALCIVSIGFLLLAAFLSRALRQRAAAETKAAAAQERATQLALYRTELERTVAERTQQLKESNALLEKELLERTAAAKALREHDALLNVVTKTAAELLGTQHENAVATVLDLIGQTIAVSRVQLSQITTDDHGHLRATIRNEWCAPGVPAMINNPMLQNLDLTEHMPRSVAPALLSGAASFFVEDLTGAYATLFESANMRSFLEIPVTVEGKLWGSLNFIDSAPARREWSWAESDTLRTLASLIGVAITRARYVKELADANMIVQNSPTILYRLRGEPPFPLIYISHNIVKFGHDPAELLDSADWMRLLVEPDDQPKLREAMARALQRDSQAAAIELRLCTGEGGHRWVENRYTPVREKKEGRLIEVEGIIIDITERKAAEEKIAQLARTDSLTGLANRTTFIERLQQAFAASRRGASPFAILSIDLDHFKDVNDTLGHPVGDALLREVATRLRSCARSTDVVARLGGDEFAIVQMDVHDPADAGSLAAKLQRILSMRYLLEANEINVVSASIGICCYTTASAGPEAMLAQADLALYRSKDNGRNQYHFHSNDLDQQVQERVAITDELKKALEHDELRLFYQPQVDIVSGHIIGMEALVRWHHPQRGLLCADAFIPAAEKTGLTVAIGQWVLKEACRQMKAWRDGGIAPPIIAINLSLSQVKSASEFVRAVVETTGRWGIQPADLEFDVTEATLAQATLTQNDLLSQLRRLGARIAIEDFGTEYSSFEYLRAYDVNHIKLGRALFKSATPDCESTAIIRAIMNMARELDVGVIAQGIETAQQRALLTATGSAPQAQGLYFSGALDAERAAELLRKGSIRPVSGETSARAVPALLLENRK